MTTPLQVLLSRHIDLAKKAKKGRIPDLKSVVVPYVTGDLPMDFPFYENEQAFSQALDALIKENKPTPPRAKSVDYNGPVPSSVRVALANAISTLGVVIGSLHLSDGTNEEDVNILGFLANNVDGSLTERFRSIPPSKLTHFVPPQYRTPAEIILGLGEDDAQLLKLNQLNLELEHEAKGIAYQWISIDPRYVTANQARAKNAQTRKQTVADASIPTTPTTNNNNKKANKASEKRPPKPPKRRYFLSSKLVAKLDTAKLIVEQAIESGFLSKSTISPSTKPETYYSGTFFQSDFEYDPRAVFPDNDQPTSIDGGNLAKCFLIQARNFHAPLLQLNKWLTTKQYDLSSINASARAEQFRTEQGATRHDIVVAASDTALANKCVTEMGPVVKHARILFATACVANRLLAVRDHEVGDTAVKSILTERPIQAGSHAYAFDFHVNDIVLTGYVETTLTREDLLQLRKAPVSPVTPPAPTEAEAKKEVPEEPKEKVKKPRKPRKPKEQHKHVNVELPAANLGYDAGVRLYLPATPGFQSIRDLAVLDGPSSMDDGVKQLLAIYTRQSVTQVMATHGPKLVTTLQSVLFQCIQEVPPNVNAEKMEEEDPMDLDIVLDLDQIMAEATNANVGPVLEGGPLVTPTQCTMDNMKTVKRYNAGSESKKDAENFRALFLPLDQPDKVTPEQKAVVRVVFGGVRW
jgi:hypothetical protein